MTLQYCTDRQPKIGEIYLMNFGGCGNEQKGWRPGLVFQNNVGNANSPNIIALPLTSSLKKAGQPTHVVIPADGTGLAKDSMVLCENPERMSKDRIGNYLTTIPAEYMAKVAVANLLATSAISFIDPELLLVVWQKALALNATA
ncbi:MAG: type II toxin-antitoxin system PemK/MazF family toxin [Clostridia bacterium]|nr:type II toxin-antitoxin system PemK/MazF family toxin [Clostridia bacterium]